MLRRLRALSESQTVEAEALQEVLDITINGIVAGLRNMGQSGRDVAMQRLYQFDKSSNS